MPGTELSSLGLVDRANGKHTFHLKSPFGNLRQPFKKSRFPMEISIQEEKKIDSLSIYIPSEISGIFVEW